MNRYHTETDILKAVQEAGKAPKHQVEKLVALGPGATPVILQELDRVGNRLRKIGSISGAMFLLWGACQLTKNIWPGFAHFIVTVFGLLSSVWLIYYSFGQSGTRSYRSVLAQALGTGGSIGAIGPPALSIGEGQRHRPKAIELLTKLLPQLTTADAARLSVGEKQALFATLRWDTIDPRDYIVALLGAVAKIGDPAPLPEVRLLCQSSLKRVRDAAHACLPVLEEAARLEQQKQSLLRPVEEVGNSESLLRPAGSSETDQAVLLRAEVGEGE